MSPEPRHPSRDSCSGNNRDSGYTGGKFVTCSSLARAYINTRKARRSVAIAESVDECCVREVDFHIFDRIRSLKMEITHEEPNFSSAKTLHFRELIDEKDENVQSNPKSIFDVVYGVTTVKG